MGLITKIDFILGHKTISNQSKKIQVIYKVCCDYNEIKLEIRNRKVSKKNIDSILY